jgi:O-antigen ligase
LVVLAAVIVVALGGATAVARSGATEPRASLYHVAWHDEVLAHPFLGTGAGTFGLYWARSGRALEQGGALDAHSLYLETLAELGPLGLGLLVAMLLAPLRRALALRHSPHVATAVGAYVAFLVHAGLDWDWEMPAVVVAALCCAAAVATAELRPERPLRRAARAALLAVGLVLGACAIAGARSHTVPAAGPETAKAPRRGAFSQTRA